jgi:hypothetical protein
MKKNPKYKHSILAGHKYLVLKIFCIIFTDLNNFQVFAHMLLTRGNASS